MLKENYDINFGLSPRHFFTVYRGNKANAYKYIHGINSYHIMGDADWPTAPPMGRAKWTT